MRRIITGVDQDGRSTVLSDDQIPDVGRIWTTDPSQFADVVARVSDDAVFVSAQPPPGGMVWHLAAIQPGAGRKYEAEEGPMDDKGFHVTKTIDFVYVLDDGLLLDLDSGRLELKAGDVVLLQAASHAWKNATDAPVRFLDVLVAVG